MDFSPYCNVYSYLRVSPACCLNVHRIFKCEYNSSFVLPYFTFFVLINHRMQRHCYKNPLGVTSIILMPSKHHLTFVYFSFASCFWLQQPFFPRFSRPAISKQNFSGETGAIYLKAWYFRYSPKTYIGHISILVKIISLSVFKPTHNQVWLWLRSYYCLVISFCNITFTIAYGTIYSIIFNIIANNFSN